MAIVAVLLMWYGGVGMATIILSAATAAGLAACIRGYALYRGPYFPAATFFLLLQAAVRPDTESCLPALGALGITALILDSFNDPQNTRRIFLIYLICGTGAIWMREFAFLAVIAMSAVVLIRAFSMRGLMAAALGFVTPFILAACSMAVSPESILTTYSAPLQPIPSEVTHMLVFPVIALSCGLAAVSAAAMFLTAYGYTALARARNMAIYGMTAGAILCPLIDFGNAPSYLPLVNVCGAYHTAHLCKRVRFGSVVAMAVWILCICMTIAG